MKKLFAMLALALCAFAFTSCNNPKPADGYTLTADKTTVNPGDKITFTITGDIAGKNWGMCDYIACYAITFVDNKYVYTVPADAPDVTHEFYVQDIPGAKIFTNKIKIKINGTPQ